MVKILISPKSWEMSEEHTACQWTILAAPLFQLRYSYFSHYKLKNTVLALWVHQLFKTSCQKPVY